MQILSVKVLCLQLISISPEKGNEAGDGSESYVL